MNGAMDEVGNKYAASDATTNDATDRFWQQQATSESQKMRYKALHTAEGTQTAQNTGRNIPTHRKCIYQRKVLHGRQNFKTAGCIKATQ